MHIGEHSKVSLFSFYETGAVSVPIVLLVLGGGPGTMETIFQALSNNTPALLVKGSGGAADIFAHAYQNSTEQEISVVDMTGNKSKM